MGQGARWTFLGLSLGLLTGCAQLESIEQALGPKSTDEAVVAKYTVPTFVPVSGSKTDQTRGGVEVRVELSPVANPHVAYRASITSYQQAFALVSNPPHSSPDPVWDSFYHTVYQYPDSEAANQVDARSFAGFQVLMTPVVETTPIRLSFKLTLTNRTARILKIDLAPQVIVDGKVWDETFAHRSEALTNGLRSFSNLPPLPSVLVDAMTLEPGKSLSWEYEGPWTEEAFPAGNASGGTVVLSVPDVLVDPVDLRKENFRFIYDYATRQFSRDAVQKTSTMLLRPSVAEQLNGQIFSP